MNWVQNWEAFYTLHPPILSPTNPTVTQASYGAALGDAVGVALLNPTPISQTNEPPSGALPDSAFNFLQNDVYNALILLGEDGQGPGYITGIPISAEPQHTLLQGENPTGFNFFSLTPSQDTFVGNAGGGTVFSAPLYGPCNDPSLTNSDSLTAFGPNNFLKANFSGNHTASSVNIVGVQTWILTQTADGTVTITGDNIGGPDVISGLTHLIINDDTNSGTFLIGNNLQPVLEPNGANGFTLEVHDATVTEAFKDPTASNFFKFPVAFPSEGVDVDIQAQAFTGNDTINVIADTVGGFNMSNQLHRAAGNLHREFQRGRLRPGLAQLPR